MVAGPGAGTKVTLDQNWFQSYDGGVSPAPIGAPFYEDGSFTKLREVSATYEFAEPGDLAARAQLHFASDLGAKPLRVDADTRGPIRR